MVAHRRHVIALLIAAPTIGMVPAGAQGRFPPDRFTNLQVLSKTATAGEVVATMKEFSRGLGVRCQYCHVGREGLPLEQFDFVSDDNARKGTARRMMQLVQFINAQLQQGAPQGSAPRVTCFTCHRGAEHPVHSPEAVKPGD
ncbi:MAG: c-type cytochrome [Vicinamibacterales bacterium]